MPRDYSRNKTGRSSERRDYRRNSSTSASGVTWMLIGILVGLCIAGVAYLNQSKNHNEVEASANQKQVAVNQSAPAAAKKTNTSNTQFDFYNMLPANKVSAPTATDQNAAQTTNDNVTRPSVLPNPEKVNAILSGVTPPTATANANNLNVNANTNNNTNTTQNNNSHQNVVSANSVDDNGDIISVPKNTSNGNTPSAVQAKNIQATSSAYIIQLGAFLHYQQADQFKAQLAFSGYEAKIIPFQKNGKTLQRVWIGPYPSLTAAAAVQRQLATNQIRSTLLKVNSQ